MISEEMAEDYVKEEVPFDTTESGEKLYTENDLKYAYLAGLKAGKDMAEADLATVAYMQGAERYKTKWHKPSEKLPEECSLVLAFDFDDSEPALFEFVASDTWEWMPRRIASLSNDQIKCWCEIPKYTEEIKENDSNSSTQNRRNARRGKRC